MTISTIIVNYRAGDFLRQTLRALRAADGYDQSETIVVDNASLDNTAAMLSAEFPEVIFIALKTNAGFGCACNTGAKAAHGEFLFFLNPDTVVAGNTLAVLLDFMRTTPSAGLIGPKVLNPSGSLQRSCRRSFPTPAVAFYHLTGLSTLFPRSRRFARYNCTYLDQNTAAEVDAVSGSCMFMPRILFEKINGFDEQFFMYGEDLDLCARVRAAGYGVWYVPQTQIVHFKGKSAQHNSWHSRLAFYDAMVIFSRKYAHTNKAFLPRWLIVFGIGLQALIGGLNGLKGALLSALIDCTVINSTLYIALSLRFSALARQSPYHLENYPVLLSMHALMTLCFIGALAYGGVYSLTRYSARRLVQSSLIAASLFLTAIYIVKTFAFSRISFAIGAAGAALLLLLWRVLFARTKNLLRFVPERTIILGDGAVAAALIHRLEADRGAKICGVIWPGNTAAPVVFEGYPVVGTMQNLYDLLQHLRPAQLIIASDTSWYSAVIDVLSRGRLNHLTIKWVPSEIFTAAEIPAVIPLRDFSV